MAFSKQPSKVPHTPKRVTSRALCLMGLGLGLTGVLVACEGIEEGALGDLVAGLHILTHSYNLPDLHTDVLNGTTGHSYEIAVDPDARGPGVAGVVHPDSNLATRVGFLSVRGSRHLAIGDSGLSPAFCAHLHSKLGSLTDPDAIDDICDEVDLELLRLIDLNGPIDQALQSMGLFEFAPPDGSEDCDPTTIESWDVSFNLVGTESDALDLSGLSDSTPRITLPMVLEDLEVTLNGFESHAKVLGSCAQFAPDSLTVTLPMDQVLVLNLDFQQRVQVYPTPRVCSARFDPWRTEPGIVPFELGRVSYDNMQVSADITLDDTNIDVDSVGGSILVRGSAHSRIEDEVADLVALGTQTFDIADTDLIGQADTGALHAWKMDVQSSSGLLIDWEGDSDQYYMGMDWNGLYVWPRFDAEGNPIEASDGWLDTDVDNCPARHNPNQADRDLDRIGDACDTNDQSDEMSEKLLSHMLRYCMYPQFSRVLDPDDFELLEFRRPDIELLYDPADILEPVDATRWVRDIWFERAQHVGMDWDWLAIEPGGPDLRFDNPDQAIFLATDNLAALSEHLQDPSISTLPLWLEIGQDGMQTVTTDWSMVLDNYSDASAAWIEFAIPDRPVQ